MKTYSLLRLLAAVSTLPLAGACAREDLADDDDDLEFRGTWGCGDNCGDNTSRVNDFEIAELNLDGLANAAGVSLLGIVSPANISFPLDVIGDEFVATGSTYSAEELIGWKIQLTAGTTPFEVEIMDYYRDTSGAVPISTYALAYESQAGVPAVQNVCPEVLDHPMATVLTLIGGELYDREAIEVITPAATRWFTLACAEEATYKMKRLGYGPNDLLAGTQPASVNQRQTTLKMITADYCGEGHSFTAPNTLLHWRNASSSVDQTMAVCSHVEAIWTENGALCLSYPRREKVSLEEVAGECSLPLCTSELIAAHASEIEWTTWRHDTNHP